MPFDSRLLTGVSVLTAVIEGGSRDSGTLRDKMEGLLEVVESGGAVLPELEEICCFYPPKCAQFDLK